MKTLKNRKNIHRILWIIGYSIPILLGGSYLLANELKSKLLESLNETLRVHVKVSSVTYSGIESFPYVGLDLTGVRVDESFPAYNNHLLNAGSIRVKVNPFNLLGKKKELQRVSIKNATFRIFDAVKGNRNYEIFKDSSSDSESGMALVIQKIQLRNCRIIYQNEEDLLSLNVLAYSINAHGDFGNNKFILNGEFSGLFDHLNQGGQSYLVGKHAHSELSVEVDTKLGSYHIEKANIGLEQLNIDIEGDILMINSNPDFDIQIQANNTQVQGLISLLPNDQRYQLKELYSQGDIRIEGSIKGILSAETWPSISTNFEFQGLKIIDRKSNFSASDILARAKVTNPGKDANLIVTGLLESIKSGKSDAKTNFSFSGEKGILEFQSMSLNLNLNDLMEFNGLAQSFQTLEGIAQYAGEVEINLEDVQKPNLSGKLVVENFKLVSPNYPDISRARFKGDVNGKNINAIRLDAVVGQDELLLEGNLREYSGLWSEQRATFNGKLTGQTFNLNEFLDTSSNGSEDKVVALDLGFDLILDANLSAFKWDNLDLKNVRSKFKWTRDNINLTETQFEAWEGQHELDLSVKVDDDYYKLLTNSISEGFELQTLFEEFKSFDQEEITSEHISGKTDLNLQLSILFDGNFNLIDREVQSEAVLKIVDGRLSSYEPLEKLSAFIELEELKDIRFNELNNTVEIRHGVIYLPETLLENSTLNLMVSGTHTLQNDMDYHLSISVSELLAKKNKWLQKKREKRLEEGADGGMTAYVLMTGTPETLKFKYDRKAAANEFKKKFKDERKSFFKQIKKDIKGERTTTKDREKARWEE